MTKEIGHISALVAGLVEYPIETFVYVPSSHSASVIRGLLESGVCGYLANREEEAVGLAGGLRLAGDNVAMVMQDNGFGNALTALATFAVSYHIGLPIFANVRGGLGEYNSMIHGFSSAVPRLLESLGIGVAFLGPLDPVSHWRENARLAVQLAHMQRRPFVTLFDSLHPEVTSG